MKIFYRRSRAEMPAAEEEIEALEREGIKIDFLTLPKRFLSEGGKLSGMEVIGMSLGDPDASGRRRPIPVPGSEFTVTVGHRDRCPRASDAGRFPEGDWESPWPRDGTVEIDPKTGATNIEGIFAGGDVVTGAAYVIDAIAAGKRAARSINRYLKGEPIEVPERRERTGKTDREGSGGPQRALPFSEAGADERTAGCEEDQQFQEVALGYQSQEAIAEANRCLAGQIEGCILCGECERRCDAKAIDYGQKQESVEHQRGGHYPVARL